VRNLTLHLSLLRQIASSTEWASVSSRLISSSSNSSRERCGSPGTREATMTATSRLPNPPAAPVDVGQQELSGREALSGEIFGLPHTPPADRGRVAGGH
jgi:hypothetical protein